MAIELIEAGGCVDWKTTLAGKLLLILFVILLLLLIVLLVVVMMLPVPDDPASVVDDPASPLPGDASGWCCPTLLLLNAIHCEHITS